MLAAPNLNFKCMRYSEAPTQCQPDMLVSDSHAREDPANLVVHRCKAYKVNTLIVAKSLPPTIKTISSVHIYIYIGKQEIYN